LRPLFRFPLFRLEPRKTFGFSSLKISFILVPDKEEIQQLVLCFIAISYKGRLNRISWTHHLEISCRKNGICDS
jgi:hypothetical protein